MPITKLTCPECAAVLRPAKPLPEGKKIKCPKCDATIVARADDAISANKPPAQKSAARSTKEPAKKAAEPAKPAEPAKGDDDEGDGAGTYGFLQDPAAEKPKEAPPKKRKRPRDEDDDFDEDEDDDEEEDEEEEEKPDVGDQYLVNEQTKDPRGPAQEIVVGPSNLMMLAGIAGAFGYFGCIVLALWPFIFPPDEDEKAPVSMEVKRVQSLEIGPGLGFVNMPGPLYPTESQGGALPGQAAAPEQPPLFNEKDEAEPSKTTVMFFDMGDLGYAQLWILALTMCLFGLGIAYNCVIVYGAVETQKLEGRTWGIVGSVFAIVPGISGFGCFIILALLTLFFLRMLNDFLEFFETRDLVFFYSLGLMTLITLGSTVAGVRVLLALNKQEVIEGYEFKAD